MFSKILLNSEERAQLHGLPYVDVALYLSIRGHMDYQTGLVGEVRRVSWGTFARELFVEPIPNFDRGGSPSVDQVRRMAKRLASRGLIESVSQFRDRRLVLACPLAERGNAGSKKVSQSAKSPPRVRQPHPAKKSANPLPTESANTQRHENPSKNIAETPSRDPQSANQKQGQPAKQSANPELTTFNPKSANSQVSGNQVSSSSSSGGNTPRARVDAAPLAAALAELDGEYHRCKFGAKRRDAPGVVAMLAGWAEAGVTPDEILAVVGGILTREQDSKSIGPEYLEGPMADYLATKSNRTVQAPPAKVRQEGPAVKPGRDTYLDPAASAEADRREREQKRAEGKRKGLKQREDESDVEFEQRINRSPPPASRKPTPKAGPGRVREMMGITPKPDGCDT